ncbi:class I SAM-dependent methyltransferase [Fenollaria sporofastidiosus]|uniref:class I SAM-dependent methyltransferase n=1 Tax=Fenollaria sporofastidiosus TaxID=2811778 RepID=UPI001C001A34|nr:class I SAM-dependent methyltransferase [Fenollaria sporofastidiosus]
MYLYDIQKKAIGNTKGSLGFICIQNCIYLNKSHDDLSDINEKLTLLYNLGYLPRANKSIVTKSVSTIKSLECLINKLNYAAIVMITTYPGHEEGSLEDDSINEFLKIRSDRV